MQYFVDYSEQGSLDECEKTCASFAECRTFDYNDGYCSSYKVAYTDESKFMKPAPGAVHATLCPGKEDRTI